MKILSGMRNLILPAFMLGALPLMAQNPAPADCLQQPVAVEQSSAFLQALTAMPTPPYVPVIARGEPKFVSTASLYADVLNVSPKAVILNDIEELRFISYTLAGTPLLLVLKAAPDWTAEKSRKVVAVARTLNLSISLVWLDETSVPAQLITTISETNGRVVRLNDLTRSVLEKFCLNP